MRPHPLEIFWQWQKFAALVAGKAQLASGTLGYSSSGGYWVKSR